MTYATAKISQLVRWDGNPRPQAAAATREELKASIADKGVIMPLIVRYKSGPKKGDGRINEVIGGDTRRDIICDLIAEGRWDAEREIPIIIRDDLVGDDVAALDVAVSNNIHVPMHPMDQFYAFSQMVEMGRDVQEIANAYGVSQRIVHQRLSYAKLDERARQMVKNDERDLEWAAAMTMASPEEQKDMLDEIANDPRRYLTVHDVRRRLDDELISTDHALFDVSIVKDALVRKDLFDANGATYMTRSEFQPFQDKALEDLIEERTREGWGKVSTVSERDFDRYRYNDGVTERERAEVIFVRHGNGAISEHAGLALRVEERLNSVTREDEDVGASMFGESIEEAAASVKSARAEMERDPRVVENKKTSGYVTASRAVIIQAAMMEDPRLAIAVAVAGMIKSAAPAPLEGAVSRDLGSMDPTNTARTIVERRLDAARQIQEEDGIDPMLDYGDLLGRLVAMENGKLMTLLQVNIAKRVNSEMKRVEMLFDGVMGQEGTLLQAYWRPDRTYLSTLSKDALESLAKQILPERLLAKVTGSKSDIVETLAQIIDDAHEGGMRLGDADRQVVIAWAPRSLGGMAEDNNVFAEDAFDENDDDSDGAAIFEEAA